MSNYTFYNPNAGDISGANFPYNGNAKTIPLTNSFWHDGDIIIKSITIHDDYNLISANDFCFFNTCARHYVYENTVNPASNMWFNNIRIAVAVNRINYDVEELYVTATLARYDQASGRFIDISTQTEGFVSGSQYASMTKPILVLAIAGGSYMPLEQLSGSRIWLCGTINQMSDSRFQKTFVMTGDQSGFNPDEITRAQYDELSEILYPSTEFTGRYDVYSTKGGIFTLWAHNFVNPPLQYMTNYYKFYNKSISGLNQKPDPIPYSSVLDQEIGYNEIYNQLTTAQKEVVINNNGGIHLRIGVGHNEGSIFTPDLYSYITIYKDGTMTKEDVDSHLTTVLHPWETKGPDDEFDGDDADVVTQVPGQAMSVDNLLTTSYVVTENSIKKFGVYLWYNNLVATDIYEMQTAPIENVLSCKRIPFAETGTDAEIVLGNVHTGVGIDAGTQNYDHTVQITDSQHSQDIGRITIPTFHSKTHGSWIDMQSNISIYLPYCGIHTIPTGLCYKLAKDDDGNPYLTGRELHVVYYYDIVYGTCCANLYLDDVLYASVNGECGIDIPITASNRAANELALAKTGMNAVTGTATSLVSNLASGNVLGALGSLVGGAFGGYAEMQKQSMSTDTHYTTSGGFSSQIASFMTSTVTLFIDHVKYKRPSTYAHDKGYPCNLSRYLSKLKGYTEIDGACEIQNIPCFEEERRKIKEALMQGFYL